MIEYELFNSWAKTKHLSYNNFDPKGNFVCDPTKTNPNIIASIFDDWWDKYYSLYQTTFDKIKLNANFEVHKMIDCYNKNLGFDLYLCEDCHEFFTCAHTCKSRFCSSCGIKYQNNICESILQTVHHVKHRQMVFTIPRELRNLFFEDFYSLNILYEAVCDTLYSVVNGSIKKSKHGNLKNRKHYKKIPGFFSSYIW